MTDSEFCRYCGAGIGEHFREGEGTCLMCDPPDAEGKTRGFQGAPSSIPSCSCMTKTPAPSHHDPSCPYRVWWEDHMA